VGPFFSRLEKFLCYGTLSLLALVPFSEFILRRAGIIIPNSRGIIIHLFLVLGFLAAMMTAKSGEHIAIGIVQYLKNEKIKRFLAVFGTLLSIFILTVLAWNCATFVRRGHFTGGGIIGPLTGRFFSAVMPIGYLAIALRFCHGLKTIKERLLGASMFLLGTAASVPAIGKLFWSVVPEETPEVLWPLMNFLYEGASSALLPLVLFLVASALAGMPIFVAIGGIAMVALMAANRDLDVASAQIYSALTKTDIIAIPLFTLAGFFLSESKAGERLVKTFRLFFGWMPGGMIIAAVVISAFFTSFTGASGITILALGGILYVVLRENSYSEKFSIGLLTSAGGIGVMFPPSLAIILVASTSNTILHFMNVPVDYFIIDYFVGAIIPGAILTLAMILTGIALTSKVEVPREIFNAKKAALSVKDSFFEILLPIILITGYFTGRLTLLEISAVSVVYVIIVEVFIKRDIPISGIPSVFAKAVPVIGGVLAILAMAQGLSYAIIDSQVPERFSFWMHDTVQSKLIFLLLLNLTLFLIGCVVDIFSAILVILPLIIPLGHAYGIDPVHLGIIFIINLEAGFLTPPVGLNLFLASYRFGKPFMEICRHVLPFLFVRVIVVLLVTYLPWLTTWLVQLIR
jgi:tripartite ATP-independent transporter DctM subunit